MSGALRSRSARARARARSSASIRRSRPRESRRAASSRLPCSTTSASFASGSPPGIMGPRMRQRGKPVRAHRAPCSISGSSPACTREDLPASPCSCSGFDSRWSPRQARASSVSCRRPKKRVASARRKALRPRKGQPSKAGGSPSREAPARMSSSSAAGNGAAADQRVAWNKERKGGSASTPALSSSRGKIGSRSASSWGPRWRISATWTSAPTSAARRPAPPAARRRGSPPAPPAAG